MKKHYYGSDKSKWYIDHLAIRTRRVVVLRQHKIRGKLRLKLREFSDGRYKVYAHVGRTLVQVLEGPKSDMGKAYDQIELLKKRMVKGSRVEWIDATT